MLMAVAAGGARQDHLVDAAVLVASQVGADLCRRAGLYQRPARCRRHIGIDEAIEHINRYSSKHTEAIVTEDYAAAMRFLNEVDAACVYVNASTRFTDGGQFGLGAEVGISTQKMHARGPMGLRELTSYKWIIFGSGQVRP